MTTNRPIIVIKRSENHAGHHGGAWKVAYADFVTAMMALFIVLWLLNSSKQIREAVGGYFKDPTGTSKLVGSGKTGSGDSFTLTKQNMDKLKDEIQSQIEKTVIFDKLKKQIEITVTSEGLRVELMETDKGAFFPSGIAKPNEAGEEILAMLGARQDPQYGLHRGPHRRSALFLRRILRQLGTVYRPRERRPQGHAAQWPRPAPGHRSPRFRRSEAPETRPSRRPFESPHILARPPRHREA